MVEKWRKLDGQEDTDLDKIIYEISSEVVIRSVQQCDLIRKKAKLQADLIRINDDIAKITDLQENQIV